MKTTSPLAASARRLALAIVVGLLVMSQPPLAQVLQTCVRTKGYWSTHGSSWPLTSLVLGDPSNSRHTYTQAELLAILQLPVRKDASLTLAGQLIAAKLNVAAGSSPAPIATTLARADSLLGAFQGQLPYEVTPNSQIGADMASIAAILEDYNAGRLPASCGPANRAPVANAGSDQTVTLGAIVTLNGSGSSDPDLDPLTFTWSLVTKPATSSASLSDATAVMPTLTADAPGTYELRLVVNDGQLNSAPDTVRISTLNSGPTAHAGPDQTRVVGSVVHLDASASSDPDGDSLTFSWSFVSKPASSNAALSDSSAVDATFLIDTPGDYILRLTVSDGLIVSPEDLVTISTINSPPVANAGADATARVGEVVTLDGSGSHDVDGDPLAFTWSFVTKPTGSLSVLSNANGITPSFAIDRFGGYVLQLVVNDGIVDSVSDTVAVSTINSPPVANAGTDQPIFVNVMMQLDGSASSDVDGNALTYAWSLTSQPSGSVASLTNASSVNPTLMPDVAGTYVAQLIVNDGIVSSGADTVTLTTENRAPVAEAGVAQTVALGAMVQLDGTASSDADADSLTFSWALLSAPTGSTAVLADATGPVPTFTADTPGDYLLQLIVSDGVLSSAPDTVTISTENSAPVADAGVDQSVDLGATVQLDGSGSFDPDFTPLDFAWSLLSKPAGSTADFSDALIVNPTFVADQPGVYVVQLIVGDGVLLSAPDTMTVTAASAPTNRPPVAAAGADRTVASGVTVVLDGGGSTDPDGDSLSFAWAFVGQPTGSSAVLSDASMATPSFVADRVGQFVVQLIVTDSHGASSAVDEVTIAATGTTHGPVILSSPVTDGAVSSLYAYDLSVSDLDVGETFAFSLPIAPAGMSIDTAGRIRWIPLGNQSGLNNVAVHVRDSAGLLAAQGFSIQVSPGAANNPPSAADDRYDARTGDSLSVPAPGVLANDVDPDGNRLRARALTQPTNGTALVNADGSFTYTPFTFQEGELVLADHVNLAMNLPGTTVGVSSGLATGATDGSLGTSWLTLNTDNAALGVLSLTGLGPFIEAVFPHDVEVHKLEVFGHRPANLILAGKFQLFDASDSEIFNSGIVDLPLPGDGAVIVPDLFQRSRNIARTIPGVVYRASSFSAGVEPARAFDGNLKTQWASLFGLPAPQFLEVEFPAPVDVHRVNVFGTRNIAHSQDFLAWIIQVFDATGNILFDSGTVSVTAASSDVSVGVGVSGARRVRVTGTVLQNPGSRGSIAELEVISTETVTTRLNNTVRRARFTGTADNGGTVGLAEYRVVGSALMRRPAPQADPNVAHRLPVAVRASSFHTGNVPENAIDDTTVRNWYAATGVPGEFLEIEFPSEVTVTEVRTSNPSLTPDGFFSSIGINCTGSFTLFGADGSVHFDSGLVQVPSGGLSANITFTLPILNLAGVKRVRYTSAGCASSASLPGFSELRVFGTSDIVTPPLDVRTKFQALVGREVHSTPLVVNLTDDNGDGHIDQHDTPEIVVAAEAATDQLRGEIKVISGDDGRELVTMGAPNLVSPWSEPAVGDIDADGRPDVVAIHTDGNHLIAFEATGAVKWISDANAMPQFALGTGVDVGAVVIANLDGTGLPEIIVGASVFDAAGRLLGDGRTLGGTTGGTGLRSRMPAVADIDLDGQLDLVAGPTAYRFSAGTLSVAWRRTDRSDGYVGIANLDDDPFAEIVIVANGFVYVLNHDGTDAVFWNSSSGHAPVPIPGGGQGGAPTVADLDGDGVPEIGVAGAGYYTVFNRDGSVRWKAVTSDRTSNATGSTVFDLDGDGSVEVIYRDEVNLRIYRGTDGVLLSKMPMGSSTWAEMPVVADVDNDGHADLVVTSDRFILNTIQHTGLYVLQDVANRWVRTRRIWNEHGYHVTNVNEDATIPVSEPPHWLLSGLNSFRLNALVADGSEDNTDTFQYVAGDGQLDSSVATVHLAVRKPNSAPRITSTGPANAAGDVLYTYAVQATDPDSGDVLTFSLPTAPTGMAIDSASGLIHWTPTGAQLGSADVVVKVQDVRGLFALQGYKVQVGAAVAVPDVIGQSQTSAGGLIASATLTVGNVSTRYSPTVPADAVISQSPGAGTLVAPASAVDLVVSIGPAPTGTVPDVVGQPQASAQLDIVAAGFAVGAITGQFHATIPAGTVLSQTPAAGSQANLGSFIDLVTSSGIPPGDRDLDHDGFTGNQGDCNDTDPAIRPGAVDVAGDGIDQNCNGSDSIASDQLAPTATIASPADGAIVQMPVDVLGTAIDDNFLRYTLTLAEVDQAISRTVGSGTTAVIGGVLGRIDPTLLENGLYRLRLIVEDVNGATTVDERVYRVDGFAKVGAFRLSFVDLTVPLAGIPITAIRTYDSRVKAQRDFGVGWSLEVKSGKYRNNRPPGEGWIITDQPFPGGGFLPCIGGILETRAHLTEVRLSEREVYTFALTLTGGTLGITGGCEARASFRFITGTTLGATLDVLDGTQVLYLRGGADTVLDMNAFLNGTETPYHPQRVRLTTVDGRRIELDRSSGITRIQDANGSALTISAGGITHSSGKSMAIARDALGRIIRMTDPRGATLNYEYDGAGDLVKFVDLATSSTTFLYDATHNLLEIRDPLGNRAIRSEYDSSGRLIATIDAEGNRVDFSHDLAARRESIRDLRGQVTVHEYDPAGNIVASTDPLGNRREFTYDARNNQLTEKDPLDRVATKTYDAADNVLTAIDFDGNKRTFTYDARRNVTSVSDQEGRTTHNAYDSRGNLVQVTDADGGVTRYVRDSAGNVVSTVDAVGHTTRSVYDPAGNLVSQVDALNQTIAATYDAAGHVIADQRTRTLSGQPPEIIRRSTIYDGFNRIVKRTDALGGTVRFTYTPTGQPETATDPDGQVIRYQYDASGNQIQIDYPDGSRSTATHDPGGLVLSSTDRDGRTTKNQYDALGRLRAVTHPDGSVTTRDFDAIGRVIAIEDERQNRTSFTHAPNEQAAIDPLGGTTTHEFDSRKNRIAMTDALGRRTAFEYDSGGHLIGKTFADGSSWASTYDAAGRRTSTIDPAGRSVQFASNPLGRLLSVTDPAAGVTSYEYDSLGNAISHTDAAGRVTRLTYDAAGHLLGRQRPLGQQESLAYDDSGRVVSRTDFNGRTTSFAYDLNNRLIAKTYPNGTSISFAFTPEGLRTRAGGDTYGYDPRGRMSHVTTATGDTIAYTYDAAGNRTSIATAHGVTSFTYDQLNRLSSVADGNGTSNFSYDAVGNLISRSYPNGLNLTYTYDALNRLTQLQNVGPGGLISSYVYTLAPDGKRTRVVESGSATTRSVDYQFDSLGRLIGEQIDDADDPKDQTITYAYDAVGNRLRKSVVSPIQTLDTAYVYDDNDRLLTETTSTTVASGPTGVALWYASAGFAMWPIIAGVLSTGVCWARRAGLSRRAGRWLFLKTFAILAVIVSQAFAPTIVSAAAIRADASGAQSPTIRTVNYTYDSNGNMLSRTDGVHIDTYTYDAENRLIAAQLQSGPHPGGVSYQYDADGIRTSSTHNGVMTRHLVDKTVPLPQVLAETTGTSVVTYTYGADLISQTSAATGTRYYLFDGQGSTRQLTSAAGVTTDTYTYDAFGELLASSGTAANPFLYNGQQLDPNLGFYYLRARYYAQSLGRFVTADPFEGTPFDPPSLHRYLYTNADPVNNGDPSGLSSLIEITWSNVIATVLFTLGGAAIGTIGGGLVGGGKGAAIGAVIGAFIGFTLSPIGRQLLVVAGEKAGVLTRVEQTAQTGIKKLRPDQVARMRNGETNVPGLVPIPFLPDADQQPAANREAQGILQTDPDGGLLLLKFLLGFLQDSLLIPPTLSIGPGPATVRPYTERLVQLISGATPGGVIEVIPED